ncbi:MAG: YtxH domain-containing protein [Bacteroidales bacterium]|jgi:gas vesicle protein|nr:YtxH domain-containing protein [Bacteroidales bacterium]
MNDSNCGKGLLAFMGGIALGATLGILFAPDKGSRTRKKIVKGTKDITDAAREKIEDLIESAEEVVDELKENASNYIHRKEKEMEDEMRKKEAR